MTRKIALITGGSRGLGRAGALHLADRGTDVLLTYRTRREEAEQVAEAVRGKGRSAAVLPLDLSQTGTFGDFVGEVRRVLQNDLGSDHFHYLLNNGGHGVHASFAETSEAQFDELMAVHVKGTFFLTQALLPVIADGGRILNVSSGLARFTLPGFAAYAAAKGAIEVLTRYMAKELGERGIGVNTLAPGAIETDFGGGMVRDNAEVNGFIASQTALGRVGLPDDIGAAIAMLLSDDARWVNAQRIEASGGVFL